MLQLSYIWQEICPMFAFGTMIRGISNYHVDVTCISNINSYTKYTELTPYVVFFLKKPFTRSKNSNTKLTLGFLYGLLCICTKWSLYKMVFVWKCM